MPFASTTIMSVRMKPLARFHRSISMSPRHAPCRIVSRIPGTTPIIRFGACAATVKSNGKASLSSSVKLWSMNLLALPNSKLQTMSCASAIWTSVSSIAAACSPGPTCRPSSRLNPTSSTRGEFPSPGATRRPLPQDRKRGGVRRAASTKLIRRPAPPSSSASCHASLETPARRAERPVRPPCLAPPQPGDRSGARRAIPIAACCAPLAMSRS